MSALLAGALWLNIATAIGAPVSTTHRSSARCSAPSIAASGFGIANWDLIYAIAAGWVISPVLGGIIAASFLYFIKRIASPTRPTWPGARRWCRYWLPPWLDLRHLSDAKGLKHIWKVSFVRGGDLRFALAVLDSSDGAPAGCPPFAPVAEHQTGEPVVHRAAHLRRFAAVLVTDRTTLMRSARWPPLSMPEQPGGPIHHHGRHPGG